MAVPVFEAMPFSMSRARVEQLGGRETLTLWGLAREGRDARADITLVDKNGHHQKEQMFYLCLNNGNRAIDDEAEVERYLATRWNGGQ
jgi:hypothetical protein